MRERVQTRHYIRTYLAVKSVFQQRWGWSWNYRFGRRRQRRDCLRDDNSLENKHNVSKNDKVKNYIKIQAWVRHKYTYHMCTLRVGLGTLGHRQPRRGTCMELAYRANAWTPCCLRVVTQTRKQAGEIAAMWKVLSAWNHCCGGC